MKISDEMVEAGARALVRTRYAMHGVPLESAMSDRKMWEADVESLRPQARACLSVVLGAQADREPKDAEVEAGCAAFYEGARGLTSWDRLSTTDPALAGRYRDGIRAALLAAQEVRDAD